MYFNSSEYPHTPTAVAAAYPCHKLKRHGTESDLAVAGCVPIPQIDGRGADRNAVENIVHYLAVQRDSQALVRVQGAVDDGKVKPRHLALGSQNQVQAACKA